MADKTGGEAKRLRLTAVLLALFAFAGVTAVTLAWFSIASSTRLSNMKMDITAGPSLRFDLVSHQNISEYKQSLSTADIFADMQSRFGFDPQTTFLVPVTTLDAKTFTLKNGEEQTPSSGCYWTYTLHFMASEDMFVHLSSQNEEGKVNKTAVTSSVSEVPFAMRVAFSADGKTKIYDPGADAPYLVGENVRAFPLPPDDNMVYNNENTLFFIKAGEDKPVEISVWLEGTDEMCSNAIKGGDFSLRLRFVGADENHVPLA